MKIVTYNIHYAIGKDDQYDLERVVNSVQGADIIALQEVERNYGPPNEPLQPEDIAALLPDYYWIFDASFDIDASEKRTGLSNSIPISPPCCAGLAWRPATAASTNASNMAFLGSGSSCRRRPYERRGADSRHP